MKKKSRNLVLISFIAFVLLTGCVSKEKQIAIDAFDSEITRIEEQLTERDLVVASAETIIAAGKQSLDVTLISSLESAIINAKAITIELPKMPSSVDEINKAIENLKSFDKESEIKVVVNTQEELEKSIKQYEQVTAPNESFIIERLKDVLNITGMAAVTEDNDPNGQLNKAGGYIVCVFFSSNLVDQSRVSGNSIIEIGTDGGGSIEVYTSAEDANKRNSYLGAFDGSIFASGSHKVVGSVVVRTSNLLKGSEQKALEASIIDALTLLK